MDKESESGVSEDTRTSMPVKVKTEPPEDIKNYAESTMNELLSWYGYEDKVNSTDTENLNLEQYTDKEVDGSDAIGDDVVSDGSIDSTDTSAEKLRIRLRSRVANGQTSLAEQHRNLVTALSKRTDEPDPREGEEDTSDDPVQCAWCRKPGNKSLTLKTSTGIKAFCSEVCFTQCRRASFKKSKVCDWCKHVRHTVNYVDFQDGETQLQFCSEKCLNQYKMSIFCKETQEHLQQMQDNSDDSVTDKESEKEILITPELWLNGAQARKAAEARASVAIETEKRDILRKSFSASIEKSLKSMSQSSQNSREKEGSRTSMIDRIKSEAGSKHRRSSRKESERLTSPSVSESVTSPSPKEPPAFHIPPQLLPPGMTAAGMAPWLQQAHLMNAMGPGMPPFPAFPGMVFPGMMPPFGQAAVPDGPGGSSTDRSGGRHASTRSGVTLPTGHLLSPNSERSSVSEAGTSDAARNDTPNVSVGPAHSPAANTAMGSARRTSSLFPVDFPQMFPPPGMGPGAIPPFGGQFVGGSSPAMGVPPVTMMVPFPVPLPLPVPIPIPIPLSMEQLVKHFSSSSRESGHTTTGSSSEAGSHHELKKESRSPRPNPLHSPASVASSGSDFRGYEKTALGEPRSGSRNSCPDLSLSLRSDSNLSVNDSKPYKRSRTPNEPVSLDLSKRGRYDYEAYDSHFEDGAIDLSAKETSRRSEASCSDGSVHNGDITDSDEKSVDNNGNVTESGLPKIHIITHRDEVPLNQRLPLPPTEHPYSARRGLILDAPSVPKKTRSPSPERRVYVRNVPRDIMEAARRRCLRTRIRTK